MDYSQFAVPPKSPNPNQPEKKLVFVDPDDSKATYWWPAMVVPEGEWSLFQKSQGVRVPIPKEGELLVCYFEDGSFSVVSEKDTLPFSPFTEPYTKYVSVGNRFCKDKGVVLATVYWQTGHAPSYFSWLTEAKKKRKLTKSPVLKKTEIKSPATPNSHSPTSPNFDDHTHVDIKEAIYSLPSPNRSITDDSDSGLPEKVETPVKPMECIMSKKRRWMQMYAQSQKATL
ncbi:hypothetical protein HDV01_005258 [Terramyces sp. JEL0728]|nr:hypothetical protein HDV01_005258 [Terramyces sp. JEL0728]